MDVKQKCTLIAEAKREVTIQCGLIKHRVITYAGFVMKRLCGTFYGINGMKMISVGFLLMKKTVKQGYSLTICVKGRCKMNDNRCVCCGAHIPEGSQVCVNCQKNAGIHKETPEEKF